MPPEPVELLELEEEIDDELDETSPLDADELVELDVGLGSGVSQPKSRAEVTKEDKSAKERRQTIRGGCSVPYNLVKKNIYYFLSLTAVRRLSPRRLDCSCSSTY